MGKCHYSLAAGCHCAGIGFNTNGLIKSTIRPPHYWYQWTKQPHHGLYVLGVFCHHGYCHYDYNNI